MPTATPSAMPNLQPTIAPSATPTYSPVQANINATAGNADAEDDGLVPGMGKAEGWGFIIGILFISCCCCCCLLACCRRKTCDHGNDPDDCKECDCPCGNIRGECPECNAKVIDEHPPGYPTHDNDAKTVQADDSKFVESDLAGVVPGLGSAKVDIEMANQGSAEVVDNAGPILSPIPELPPVITAPVEWERDSGFEEEDGDAI